MKKGTLVVMIKDPMTVDILTAESNNITLPKKGEKYTLSKDSYITSWYRGLTEVIQLEGFEMDLELNINYFREVLDDSSTNSILKPSILEYEKG